MSKVLLVAGQSAYFLFGNLFTLIVGLALQIFLARTLGADGLGLFGLLESGVGVMTALLGFGIAHTALRHIPKHLKNGEFPEVHALVRKSLFALVILGGAGFALTLIAMPAIMQQWPELTEHRKEVVAVSILIPLGLLLFCCTQVLRGFLDIRHIMFGSSFLQLTVKALLSVLFIWMGYGVLGYIWAIVLASVSALVWMFSGIRSHLNRIPQPEKDGIAMLPEWKSYARVMYGNALLSFWYAPLDRFLLGYFMGAGAVGVLMIAKMLSALPGVFLQMFLSIVAPMMAAAHSEGNRKDVQQIYHLCTDWLVRISLPLVMFLMVFVEPALGQFGERFASEGSTLVKMLLVAQLVSLLCGPIGNVLNMCGLEKQMFRISVISTVSSAIIMVVAISVYGLVGVGFSVLFSVIFSNLAALYIAKSQMAFKWWHSRYSQWLWPSVITLIFSLLSYSFASGVTWLIVCLISMYFIFFGSQWLIYGYSDEDREIYQAIRCKLKLV